MKKILLLMPIAYCLLPSLAMATEKFVDRSLSVEDSLKEPSIRKAPPVGDTGFAPDVPIDPNTAKQLNDLRSQNNANIAGGAGSINIPPPPNSNPFSWRSVGGGYMAQFCAGSCGGDAKQQACTRFKAAAVNVQELLDRVVTCEVKSGSTVEYDCDSLDSSRIDLLKQYWQDEDMSYTILFLPDMVLNAAANCPTRK